MQEVWTLCRIFKRNVSYRKCTPDWKEISGKRLNNAVDASSKTCSMEFDNVRQSYISFSANVAPAITRQNDKKPLINNNNNSVHGLGHVDITNQLLMSQLSSFSQAPSSTTASYASFASSDATDFLKHGDWDELRSMVEFGAGPTFF